MESKSTFELVYVYVLARVIAAWALVSLVAVCLMLYGISFAIGFTYAFVEIVLIIIMGAVRVEGRKLVKWAVLQLS